LLGALSETTGTPTLLTGECDYADHRFFPLLSFDRRL